MVAWHLVLGENMPETAIQISEQSVRQSEQSEQYVETAPAEARTQPGSKSARSALNWEDLHVFRIVAASDSFREAAKKLRRSVNSTRDRIARLEEALGTTLFNRTATGISLTSAGLTILETALEMQDLSNALPLGCGNHVLIKPGEMRICCSEGIGEFWLTPRLNSLRAALPGLTVSLQNDFDQLRIHSRSNDVSIGFIRPHDPDRIISRIATLHFMMFASDAYLQRFGHPRTIDEIADHCFVVHDAPGLSSDALRLFLGEERLTRQTVIRVNTSHSLYWAVANSVGIGPLPTYVRAISRSVQPLELPVQLRFDLWMSYARSAKASIPVRETVTWLRSCFDPVRFPWFAERFHHPSEIEHQIQTIPPMLHGG